MKFKPNTQANKTDQSPNSQAITAYEETEKTTKRNQDSQDSFSHRKALITKNQDQVELSMSPTCDVPALYHTINCV